MSDGTGKGRRVLIVEDELLLALTLEDVLAGLGHRVTGVATRLDQALRLARDGDIDFAILDINLAGTLSFPVADILRERGIPFIFASGYGIHGLIEGYRDEPVLAKPFRLGELVKVMAGALAH